MPLADALHSNPLLQKKLEAIYGLHRKEMDFRLGEGPYRDLLEKLGNPHLKLPPVIHVAGTNGKGSTIAMIRALAEREGLKIHAYTSPHLFQFNERIRLAGMLIDDETLLNAIDKIDALNAGAEITFFEFTTAMAFDLFARIPADLCLLETGLGGRLDCTNIVPAPAVSVITQIGWDHMHILGDSLEKIASEKAGIMKPGVPCVVSPQPYPYNVMRILEGMADAVGIELTEAVVNNATPRPSLAGAHQMDNMATALAAFRVIRPNTNIPKTLDVYWPGRIMPLQNPPTDWRLFYDGAHNIDSARALADTMEDKNLTLILAIQGEKDPLVFLAPFLEKDKKLTIIPVDLPAGRVPQTGEELYQKLQSQHGISLQPPCETLADAIASLSKKGGTAIITGSLYSAQLIPAQYWPMMEG